MFLMCLIEMSWENQLIKWVILINSHWYWGCNLYQPFRSPLSTDDILVSPASTKISGNQLSIIRTVFGFKNLKNKFCTQSKQFNLFILTVTVSYVFEIPVGIRSIGIMIIWKIKINCNWFYIIFLLIETVIQFNSFTPLRFFTSDLGISCNRYIWHVFRSPAALSRHK